MSDLNTKNTTDCKSETDRQVSIGVLGAGTWGIALATLLATKGYEVVVWSALSQEIESLRRVNVHAKLPGVKLPDSLQYTSDIAEACHNRDIVLIATPSVYVRGTAQAARPFIPQNQIVVCVSKGIETQTLKTMTDIIDEELAGLDPRLVALSGPTHAEEVARCMSSAIVSASTDTQAAEYVQDVFATSFMRVYTNDDPKGVELCGAIKNVIALASGIAKGLGCGDNARAALITRGLAEMKRLGVALGCKESAFNGLAGLGDLVVTCTSEHSRNNKAGFLMGQGLTPDQATHEVGMVVEGLNALPAMVRLRDEYQVDMPIVSAVDDVVSGRMSAEKAIEALYVREQRAE